MPATERSSSDRRPASSRAGGQTRAPVTGVPATAMRRRRPLAGAVETLTGVALAIWRVAPDRHAVPEGRSRSPLSLRRDRASAGAWGDSSPMGRHRSSEG